MEKLCSAEGCNKKYYAKGYCEKHYDRFKRLGSPDLPNKIKLCAVDGCEGKYVGLGYCRKHYDKFKKYGDPTVNVKIIRPYAKEEKLCPSCGEIKSADQFGKRAGTKSHLLTSHCTKCLNERAARDSKKPENKPKLMARRKRHYEKNKEHERKTNKIYMETHRDSINLAFKKRYKKNPDKIKARAKQRRARKNNCKGSFTHIEWIEKLEEFNYCCAYCLKHESIVGKLSQDHIVPISKNGDHSTENIVPACKSCNSSKNNRHLLKFLFGINI